MRTGSGWLSAEDAWLAIDRNGNGLIDSGRELLGTDYVKADDQFARSGADALSDLDSRRDGVIDDRDAAFGDLRLWQDINQNGISESDELFSLADKGIRQISLAAATAPINLGNGNTQLATLQVTRTDGTTTVAADLQLAHNPFYRDFAREVTISDTASSLPQMRGAGWVRDLREAMSLGTSAAQELIEKVQVFANGRTKAEQLAALDGLIRAWAGSNEFRTLAPVDDPLRRFVVPGDPAASARMQAIIPVLEIFNGMGVAEAGMQAPTTSQWPMAEGPPRTVQTYTLLAAQVAPLLQAYERLRESLYDGLVLQTRLKPYLDTIEVSFGEAGLRLDTSGIAALATQRAMTDPVHALSDLLELRSLHKRLIPGLGWNANQALAQTVSALPTTLELTQWLTANRLIWIGTNTSAYTTSAAENGHMVIGNALDNTLAAERSSANQFIGGKGNDTLIGGYRGDTYHFARGDGADTIIENWSDYHDDTLQFGDGITADDIGAQRVGADLVLSVAGQKDDQITIHRWFESHEGEELDSFLIERLRLADGSTIDIDALAQRAQEAFNRGTDGADTLVGDWRSVDLLFGGNGDDTLYTVGRDDVLDGGAGDDILTSDTYWAGGGTFTGGLGADRIAALDDSTIIYRRGDGQDTIDGVGWRCKLSLRQGIAPEEIGARRSGEDLILSFTGSPGDGIVFKSWFDSYYRMPKYHQLVLAFDDGRQLNGAQLTPLALLTTNTGTAADDVLTGTHGAVDHLLGGGGNDQLTGTGYRDVLDGGAGNDVLRGDMQSVLIGGQGDDTLYGSALGDTYHYRRGDGSDTLTEWASAPIQTDLVHFGEGIAPEHVSARRVDQDLVLSIDGHPGDRITVKHWFFDTEGEYRIEELRFADGTVWRAADLTQRALSASNKGSDGDDQLAGWSLQVDRLEGGQGNDTLTAAGDKDVLDGGAGDDLLRAGTTDTADVRGTTYIGGQGNDTIRGSRANDVYVFNRGDGSDTLKDFSGLAVFTDELRFGAGIARADIRARRSHSDLVIGIAGAPAGDSITIQRWFDDVSGTFHIERFGFADGSVMSAQDMDQLAQATGVQGTDGDDQLLGTVYHADRLFGGAGQDTLTACGSGDLLDGGAGDDVLGTDTGSERATVFIGGAGADTIHGSYYADSYHYQRGDGDDTIFERVVSDGSTQDSLHFGENITPEDIRTARVGDGMVITVDGQDGDRITLPGWFQSQQDLGLQRVTFTDGRELTREQLEERMPASVRSGTAGDDIMFGHVSSVDHLQGGAGKDMLIAAGAMDVLEGGDGDDMLYANDSSTQNSTLMGGPGADTLLGSLRRDVYVFKRGDGSDSLSASSFQDDELQFGEGIRVADIGAYRSGNDLVLNVAGQSTDKITIYRWFSTPRQSSDLSTIRFSDGSTLSGEQLTQLALDTSNTGSAGGDVLSGTLHHVDHLRGGNGNDVLSAVGAGDTLDGGAGHDTLSATNASGGTTLVGGPGTDFLRGSRHGDVYRFARGDGRDTLIDNSQGDANADRLELDAGIGEQDVWLSRVYDDLRLQFLGGYADSVQIKDWYKGPQHQIETIALSDGQALLQSQVNVLVEAMAAFAPPPMGQTSLTPQQQVSLAPLIAASWS